MPLKLHDLATEEALVAALLLHDDFAALEHFSDNDLWYDHLRPIIAAVRQLHAAGKPCGTVFVLFALDSQLDSLSWRGDVGEVMLLDLLGRHVESVQSYYGPALGQLVHFYAQRRRALQQAHAEGTQLYQSRVSQALSVLERTSGAGFIDD